MLQIRNLTFSIGGRVLLDRVNWIIRPARRAALIGSNGAGKTTLLRILTGELQPESGNIQKSRTYKIGYLPQEEISIDSGSALEVVLMGKKEIVTIEQRIKELRAQLDNSPADAEKLIQKLSSLEQQFELLDGYALESNAKKILSGLGFGNDDYNAPISQFSGGWRMRVYLARLLLQMPDLLLLDEPTNHLDLPSLEWLEQFLLGFPGSIIIVSHDRFFIDRLAQEIYELNRGHIEHYAGNYQFYEQEKQAREALLQKKIEEQKAERERQEKFINRFRYKATKAVQVQSRIKQLEKMELIEAPSKMPKRLDFNLLVDVQSYKDVLTIREMSFRYDTNWVLENINLNIYRGEKVALVGVNGAGKTTFTKLIASQLQPQQGTVKLGQRTHIGYYAQHQVDALNVENSIYDEVKSTVATSLVPRIRDVLGIFLLSGEDVYKKIGVLSGGEKARVSLSKILLSPVNFLIMDEPTNHLDMNSKEALEKALQNYDGTLLLISHDRYFLDKLVDRVLEIKDGRIKEYLGNYSDYLRRREQETISKTEQQQNTTPATGAKKSRQQKQLEAQARQTISKKRNTLTDKITALETEIEQLESRQSELENEMANPEIYQNGDLIASLQREYAANKDHLQSNYSRWEQVQSELEELLESIQ